MRRAALLLAAVVTSMSVAPPAQADRDRVRELFRFRDPAIVESSGLAVVDGVVVTLNDSGNDPELFTVDPDTGRTVSVARWAPSQVDAEALAPAPGGDVWVGDIGDNGRSRSAITVTRTSPTGRGGTTYRLRYPKGETADAEALLADPAGGGLYVVTKGLLGGRVYAAPATLDPDGPNRLRAVAQVTALVTDGAVLPDGRHAVLRDYGRAYLYTFPDFRRLGDFSLPRQPQGEGLAVAGDGSLYLSSEGAGTAVLRTTVPKRLREEMDAAPTADPSAPDDSEAPEPSATGTADPEGSGDAAAAPDPEDRPWEGPLVLVAGAGVAGLLAGLVIRMAVRRRRRP